MEGGTLKGDDTMENMNPTQFRMLTEELPEDHPIGDMMVKTFLSLHRQLFRDCERYVIHKDSQRAWGSAEHVNRDQPW